MQDKLVFLHVSDIHLREEELSSGIELDRDLRNELVLDLRRLCGVAFSSLDGVLLTGDVAFAGKPAEFASALAWLDELRAEFGFSEGAVWSVPGNHDVDRSAISGSAVRRKLRESVRAGGEANAASELHELLKDEGAHSALVDPLHHYNQEFANQFQCTTECPELLWIDKIPFTERYEVVLHGLNSAIISDSCDSVGAGRLVLGSQLQAIGRRPGAINVSLCHHPPRWLFDDREVRDHLDSRTTLQLSGHEHDSRIVRVENSVCVSAGALHPQRNEDRWEPRFNLIVLALDQPASTELRVEVWPRLWDRAGTEFRSAPSADDGPCVSHMMPLPDPLPADTLVTVSESPESAQPPKGQQEPGSTSTDDPIEESHQMPRDIVYRFYRLSWIQRLRAAIDLGLYSDEDADVSEAEMARRVFTRARERNVLGDLEAIIEASLAQSQNEGERDA
jgi:predicted MPP superfamily phosphohydrolase